MSEPALAQGTMVRMVNNGEPVRQFILLETEVIEDVLNALLYEVSMDGNEVQKDKSKRASLDWWWINSSDPITWQYLLDSGEWETLKEGVS